MTQNFKRIIEEQDETEAEIKTHHLTLKVRKETQTE